LVLEDDACAEPGFAAAFRDTVLPLLAVPDQWDCLFLGYFRPTAEEDPVSVATPSGPVRLRVISQFFGAHGYILSRHAATVLRRHAYPLDQQSDGLVLTLRDLGLLRVYCLPTPVLTQCMDKVDRLGSWHTHRVLSESGPFAMTIGPWLTSPHCVLTVLVSVAATVALMRLLSASRGSPGVQPHRAEV
jgi:hypothetical protein